MVRNGSDFSSEVGIPSGLNRIKTRRISANNQSTSGSCELIESQTSSLSGNSRKQERKAEAKGRGRTGRSSGEGLIKGRSIARWFKSHLSNESTGFNKFPPKIEDRPVRLLNKDSPAMVKLQKRGNAKQQLSDSVCCGEVLKGLKSFSHELEPESVIPPVHPRAHSFNDLKELLGSLHSRFHAAKEVVDIELANFAGDVTDMLERTNSYHPKEQKMLKDLLILSQRCIEMTFSEFRSDCETIVRDLTEKRQQCLTDVLKWLFTRMLFILTRYTRLLQFQKDSDPINESSLNKFKECIESIPSIETSWIRDSGLADSGSDYSSNKKCDSKIDFQGNRNLFSPDDGSWCRSRSAAESIATSRENFLTQMQPSFLDDSSSTGKSIGNVCSSSCREEKRSQDEEDTVICRICEEFVPASHLESHSYICAYAEKCELNCLDTSDRLMNLAAVLEEIIHSLSTGFPTSYDSPENLRTEASKSVITSKGYSPKVCEWRNKGVEGMFEDIHEMDTAYIDESYITAINLKGLSALKLSNQPGSSPGSVTSLSSTNTPRAGHFDSFWLEHNNPCELEDVGQMADLADIARCVAGSDISKEGSQDFLLACMQDLQGVLQHSKLKALVIDTFGGRIEKLLREKCILSCDAMDGKSPKSDSNLRESSTAVSEDASQSSNVSTPLHSSRKERTSIDDFEIIKPISKGAFGRVFLACKRTTGDLFAIKVLKKGDMIRKNDVERILAERNILITVRNPFVVRFFYSFTCRENLYLVMEYLNGGDLYSLLRNIGCLEEEVARVYIAELVLALEYLHSLGIIHRDLKPDNLLIAHDGHIKLTDFGLSKIGLINITVDLSRPQTAEATASGSRDGNNQPSEDTNRQSAIGTPDYLAPEILLGTEHGYAADWWSVGIILFELLTGIPPFTGELPEIIFDNILNRKIPWPSVPGDMSYEAQDLINRFLMFDPNQRLGAHGSAEVKAHPFFKGVNWDSLALQKAAFIPQPDSADDTSYFVPRFSNISLEMQDNDNSDDSDIETSKSNSGVEMDDCSDLAEFGSSPLNLSVINFSFKNLSQLASINHDVLKQSGKGSPFRVSDS